MVYFAIWGTDFMRHVGIETCRCYVISTVYSLCSNFGLETFVITLFVKVVIAC